MVLPCSKCGLVPRQGNHRWCLGCQRKADRDAKNRNRIPRRTMIGHDHQDCHDELLAARVEIRRLTELLEAARVMPVVEERVRHLGGTTRVERRPS